MQKTNSTWALTTILCNIIVIYFCLTPSPPQVETPFSRIDLIVHFTSYFVLTFLAMKGFKRISYVAIFFIVQGVAIEFIQPYFGRNFEISDIVVNSLGVLASAFLVKKLKF